jgi:hypothetical protein
MSIWSKIWDIPYHHEYIDGDSVMTNKEAYGIIFSPPRRSARNFMLDLFKALDKSNKQNTMPPIPTPQRVPVGFTTTLSTIKMDITTEALIITELASIPEKYRRPFNSTHEGFAVLKEEVDELWDEVKKNGSKERLRAEAVQVAAMAVRFIQELTSKTTDEQQKEWWESLCDGPVVKRPISQYGGTSTGADHYFTPYKYLFSDQQELDKATTNHFHLEENAHDLKTMGLYERSFKLTKALKAVSEFYAL